MQRALGLGECHNSDMPRHNGTPGNQGSGVRKAPWSRSASDSQKERGGLAWRLLRSPAVCFSGLGLMRFYYHVGIAFTLLGFLACSLELIYEPWFLKKPWWVNIAGFAVLVALLDLFLIGSVLRVAPIDVEAYVHPSNYAPNAVISGIAWHEHLTDLRAVITNPTDDGYQDTDISIIPDSWIHKAAIVGNSYGCSLESLGGDTVSSAIAHESGKVTITEKRVGAFFDPYDSSGNVYTTVAANGGYRMRCGTLPSHSTVQIILALVSTPPDFYRPKEGWAVNASEWSGVKNFLDIFGNRPSPTRVVISARYSRGIKPYRLGPRTLSIGERLSRLQ
jgi:hypothetical protein